MATVLYNTAAVAANCTKEIMSIALSIRKIYDNKSWNQKQEELTVPSKNMSELIFFPKDYPPPSSEVRQKYLTDIVYKGFVGNSKAVHRLMRIDFDALGHYNHLCKGLSVALIGKSGSGKTEIVHRHTAANGLPTAEISPKAIRLTHDIFNEISRVCELKKVPLIETEEKNYCLPPVNVFIDEVHALAPNIIQGLLKATEHKDSTLVTERGFIVNCANVHWIIATTDRGKLFDAFDTRFIKVQLNLYKKEEVAQIVSAIYPEWDADVCNLVAHYCSRVPREALDFAKEMRLEHNMNPKDWKEIAAKVAEDSEIDQYGMTFKRLAILKALGQEPVAAKRLPIIAGVKEEELEKFILPWLLESTDDQPPYIGVSQRGYIITEAGLVELDKRKIPHKQKEELE